MPTRAAFWAAIVVVGILFGLGHLPATAAMAPLTPVLVVRALALNGVAGVAFGYLCWRHGLEAAMVGHMSAPGHADSRGHAAEVHAVSASHVPNQGDQSR